jgi:ELWxxDGT repeat protein
VDPGHGVVQPLVVESGVHLGHRRRIDEDQPRGSAKAEVAEAVAGGAADAAGRVVQPRQRPQRRQRVEQLAVAADRQLDLASELVPEHLRQLAHADLCPRQRRIVRDQQHVRGPARHRRPVYLRREGRIMSGPHARLVCLHVRHRWLAVLVVGLAVGASAAAQTGLPGLLRDVAESPAPNWGQLVPGPAVFVPLGGELYFASWDLTEGLELRATDGTAAGTRTVRDVCPGSCGGFAWVELVESGGVLYFGADDGEHGRELWRSDGTRAGTRRVASPGGPAIARMPEFLAAAPGGVYFVALDAAHGSELWWSDGTAAGTHLVIDLWPGSLPESGEGPSDLMWLAGVGLVFAADDGVHGREPWITQGSAATTQLLADVRPGAAAGIGYREAYPNAYARRRCREGRSTLPPTTASMATSCG